MVLGIEEGDDALGFPLPRVEATVNDRDVVIVATRDDLYAFKVSSFGLDMINDGHLVGDGTGWIAASGWSDDGRTLQRIPTRRLFGFAWQDDHGPNTFYG